MAIFICNVSSSFAQGPYGSIWALCIMHQASSLPDDLTTASE